MSLFSNETYERIIHSIKTAVACLIGFSLTLIIPFKNNGQWLIVTIIVVMCAQINVGSVLQKSYMRLIGTLTGSIIAAVTLTFFSPSIQVTACVIGASILLFSFIATSDKNYSASGPLGAVTVIIILINQGSATVTGAAERFLEISVGITIAALVSQFIFPINARYHLKMMQAKALSQIREYYIATLMMLPTQEVTVAYHDLDEAIVKSLSSQRVLASESKHELLGVLFDPNYFEKILRCEKEIFRSIVGMHYAYRSFSEDEKNYFYSPNWTAYHQTICDILTKLEQQVKSKYPLQQTITFPQVPTLNEFLSPSVSGYTITPSLNIDSYLFNAAKLVNHLRELKNLLANANDIDENQIQ
ncbi:MAG: FUSC family protein [Gammaproteobacteria bacterium]|nr:FUSC family protein [Gammaproteobacteria bacterium]